MDEETPPAVSILGKTGIAFASEDGRHSIHLLFRGQLRYSTPFDTPPLTPEQFEREDVSTFDLRRVRLKLGGNVYREWLGYYLEYDFKSNALLDLRFTLSPRPWLQFRAGQWKANFNRERVDSSGRQQFAERSIVTRVFTVDRQPGVMLFGRLLPGRRADSWYYLGVFNGNGRNAINDDTSMMWLVRYQWNFLRRDLRFSQSDVEFHEKPTGSLAFAVVGNESPYTRFSSGGGGQLPGFEEGVAGQYGLLQYVEETALKYRGFSLQHEFHWKEIEDNINETLTRMRGTYIQIGYFPWGDSERALRPLELAGRYAWVDPDTTIREDDRREWTLAANWFFSGHDNKLTLDLSRLEQDVPSAATLHDNRIRFQWDISF